MIAEATTNSFVKSLTIREIIGGRLNNRLMIWLPEIKDKML